MKRDVIKLILNRWGVPESHPKFDALVDELHNAAEDAAETAFRAGGYNATHKPNAPRVHDLARLQDCGAKTRTPQPSISTVPLANTFLRFSNHACCNRFI